MWTPWGQALVCLLPCPQCPGHIVHTQTSALWWCEKRNPGHSELKSLSCTTHCLWSDPRETLGLKASFPSCWPSHVSWIRRGSLTHFREPEIIVSIIPSVMDVSQGPWISYLEFALTSGAYCSETHLPSPLPWPDLGPGGWWEARRELGEPRWMVLSMK